MSNRLDKHPKIQLWLTVFLIVVGCGLLIAGVAIPPAGEIHPSILVAFGEVCTFAGAVLGIDYHYTNKYGSR